MAGSGLVLMRSARVAFALCLAGLAAVAACGGDGEPKEQPTAILSGGALEVLSPSFEIPAEHWSLRVEFQDTPSDWDANANWRITVYAAETRESVAYVERRVTAETETTEAWGSRRPPGTGLPAAAGVNTASTARFGPGPGTYYVGVSVTGIGQWSAAVFNLPPKALPL